MMKTIYISTSQQYADDLKTLQLINELKKCGYDILRNDCAFCHNITQSFECCLDKADIVIGILKDSNPNLLFELGYAAGRNKQILIITDKLFELPFELNKYSIFKFSNDHHQIFIDRIVNYIDKLKIQQKEIIKPKNFNEFVDNLKKNPNYIDNISPIDFENIIGMYFKDSGYDFKIAGWANDCGYDLEISNYKNFGKTLVEVKKYNSGKKVSMITIQQLLEAINISEANHGIIIATSGFTASAKDFVNSIDNTVELWTLSELIENGSA